jgi:hypothetical protein
VTSRALTLPATEPAMWRKLLARCHPDSGGGHELYIWATAVKEEECARSARPSVHAHPEPTGSAQQTTERVPFDSALGYEEDFWDLTHRALSIGKRVEEPHCSVLIQLIDCGATDHGRRAERQMHGASYKQLAYIAHLVSMSRAARCRWYEVARNIPLSDAHASHIITRLKAAA